MSRYTFRNLIAQTTCSCRSKKEAAKRGVIIIYNIICIHLYLYLYISVKVTFFNQVRGKVSTTTHDYKATKDLLKPSSRHYDFPLQSSKPTRQIPSKSLQHSLSLTRQRLLAPPTLCTRCVAHHSTKRLHTHKREKSFFIITWGKKTIFQKLAFETEVVAHSCKPPKTSPKLRQTTLNWIHVNSITER